MRGPVVLAVLLISLSAITPQLWANTTFRCGSALVSVEDPMMEVEQKCGPPADRRLIGYKEVGNRYTGRYQIPIEEWIYGPNHGMYYILRFEGGYLKDLDSHRGN